MKLVDILALELKEWPEGVRCLTQSVVDKEIYDAVNGDNSDNFYPLSPPFNASEWHTEDSDYPHVTRAEWQAAVDALKAPGEKVLNIIDWSKAPEGTTGAMIANFTGEKTYPGKVEFIPSDEHSRDVYREGPDAWIYFPAPTPWTGEGLPPVGTVCEAAMPVWEEVTVIAHGLHYGKLVAVLQMGNRIITKTDGFRPIRTPEQIAAEERQKGIEELGNFLASTSTTPTPYLWEAAQKIYDAGWRRSHDS